jgi:hypothetical protein
MALTPILVLLFLATNGGGGVSLNRYARSCSSCWRRS